MKAIRKLSEVPAISMEGQVETAENVVKVRAASEAVGRQDSAQEEGEATVVVVVEHMRMTSASPTPAEVVDPFSRPRDRMP